MSAVYLGIAGAGAMGGLILNIGGIAYLGAVCSLMMVLALVLILFNTRLAGKSGSQRQELPASPVLQEKS